VLLAREEGVARLAEDRVHEVAALPPGWTFVCLEPAVQHLLKRVAARQLLDAALVRL
jgi:hypothetical protein